MKTTTDESKAETIVTIQATGKRWKSFRAAGVILIIGAIVMTMDHADAISANILILGIMSYLYGRIGGWWHHG